MDNENGKFDREDKAFFVCVFGVIVFVITVVSLLARELSILVALVIAVTTTAILWRLFVSPPGSQRREWRERQEERRIIVEHRIVYDGRSTEILSSVENPQGRLEWRK